MKIVYFTEWDAFNYSGVLSKIEGQTEVWENLGYSCVGYVMNIPFWVCPGAKLKEI